MRSMPDCLACGWNSPEPEGSDEHARSTSYHRKHFCKGSEASTNEYGVRFTRRYWGESGAIETDEETVGPWTKKYATDWAKRANKNDPEANAVVVTRIKTIVTTPWKETS